ncbi:MAG TPA: chondroitinase family polysaccharide lyase [Planctomycetota bacterium]|nr:chondroitinase family polysaccharide lyase [Planctomycetota bacterium]
MSSDTSKDGERSTPGALESFEGKSVPGYWKVNEGGSLSISKRRCKDGAQSLHWTWQGRSTLACEGLAISTQQHTNAGLKGWVYNESPINDRLTITLGSQKEISEGNARYAFRFGLNFRGWRAFWVRLENDAKNPGHAGCENSVLEVMKIAPPAAAESGSLHLDAIAFVEEMPPFRSADYQIPEHPGGPGGQHWPLHYIRQEPSQPLPPAVTQQDKHAFETITARYTKWLLGEDIDLSNAILHRASQQMQEYKLGREKFRALNLTVDGTGCITGPGLSMGRGPDTFHHVFYNIMLPLVFDCKINNNESSRDAVLLLFDYVHDQGWAEGSANGSLMLNCLIFAPYCHSVLLMRDELKASGRMEAAVRAAMWYLHFGKSFERFGDHFIETNADELRSIVFTSLVMVLAMDDTPRKVQYMKGWLNWLNNSLELSPRFAGLIKPCHIGYHHMSIYASCYTTDAYEFAALIVYLLHGTRFAAAQEAVDNLKNALRTQAVMSNKYDVPLAVQGRMPGHRSYGVIAAYACLALASDPIDPEMAGIFMRYWDPDSEYFRPALNVGLDGRDGGFLCNATIGRVQLMKELADLKLEACTAPVGFWMKPYGALAIHRRGDWMVSTKGWSQYVWDFEGHFKTWAAVEENVYARYVSHGHMQVLAKGNPVNAADSGCDIDRGWDWNRWPGTTTKHLPLSMLYSQKETYACRMFTDETFVGGVSSEGKNGMFAMKLHDTYNDTSFRAIKSYFYFDNEIICLGSNIENDDRDYPTETTLFQSCMSDKMMAVWINGELVKDFPYSQNGEAGKPFSIMDPYGNGYIIPKAEDVRVTRCEQESRDASNQGATKGVYSTCWIDHGRAPEAGEYEYVMLVQSAPEDVEACGKTPRYRVLQKDRHAHILEHVQHNTMAYAIFQVDRAISHGIIRKTSAPVMAMVRKKGDEIIFSLADADLRLPKRKSLGHLDEEAVAAESKMQKVCVHLHGQWKMKASPNEVRVKELHSNTTVVEFDCIDGKTIEVALLRSYCSKH